MKIHHLINASLMMSIFLVGGCTNCCYDPVVQPCNSPRSCTTPKTPTVTPLAHTNIEQQRFTKTSVCSVRNDHNICQQHELFENNCDVVKSCANYLPKDGVLRISVVGQGVAPCNGACSPAQAMALAKRAAIADSYRLIAEKVKGVYVEGDDYIKNMMVKRSVVRTHVSAMVRNANIVETSFKDGLCEVEMEIVLYYADLFPIKLSSN